VGEGLAIAPEAKEGKQCQTLEKLLRPGFKHTAMQSCKNPYHPSILRDQNMAGEADGPTPSG
jgi:hypothetical protein